ncbi:helix-hairpin-helix domain-containing protein [Haloarchaeobius sp. HRN-SO-5]|uniref:helix-hairpin-helix domain-containing protein n=1 Tax=Haloarchaeobius sp. HRN-SO-5 TaxID=3446118 RepID=UPI003EC02DAB
MLPEDAGDATECHRMKNQEIAKLLREIADFLEIQDVEYKPRAYRDAARSVESLSDPIETVYERGDLEEIEGVGESIAAKIAEYLETGELEYYEELRADLPIDIEAITSVEGVGPKTAKRLYLDLGVATLEDLERAAEAGEIAELDGFGEKSQQNILDHVEQAKAGQERMLLGRAFPVARDVESRLRDDDAFDRVDIVGSFRRRQPTVGDLDVLATSPDADEAMEVFCTHDDVTEVLARGGTKSSVVASGGLQMDLRIVDEAEYGAAFVYFTGSKAHNIALRNRAIDRDWKLNEYGLFDVSELAADETGRRVGERLAGETEDAIYETLDLTWIPPELREDTGEVDAAAAGELPELVELADVRGDLQVHTEYSDGTHSVREMAEAADERGLEYVLVTDHGPNAPIPSKLDPESFESQCADVEAVNDDEDVAVTVLQGIEAEITDEGLEVPADWFDRCDVVVAGMHSRPSDPTGQVVRALREFPVDVFAHPTNRLINEREPLDLDLDSVMAVAAEEHVAIEINAQPERLDLDWQAVKEYRDSVQYVVSTDAHTTGELDFVHLGVSQARRGWCEADDVLNTRSVDALTQYFEG